MRKELHIERPCKDQVLYYLRAWDEQENYVLQEHALDKLFFETYPNNTDINDILIKASSLNDFYSTNIFDIHTVAQHILSLHIDERLEKGDRLLVNDIAHVEVNGKDHFFYSFATKYCSHHRPERYAIYDSYVEKVLVSMNSRKHFAYFKREELKDYVTYMSVIRAFQQSFGLMQYDIKKLDQYLWQLGKWYFNPYGLSFKYYNREDESPFPENDSRSKFWEGEMMYVTSYQNGGLWKNEGKEWLKTANDNIKELAQKYTLEQFGLITYIAFQYSKWYPYEDPIWIIDY